MAKGEEKISPKRKGISVILEDLHEEKETSQEVFGTMAKGEEKTSPKRKGISVILEDLQEEKETSQEVFGKEGGFYMSLNIVEKILLALPAESISRFRCV
ncbi:hypothetical protein AMTR_s00202p00032250 [Amborella trichopoda]|uniref:Uncharacterized protein n=1 Tax=Amborella trichopoda TaxID=13333 RepID=W1NML0_AMBTC|nr:hypothetical protein AMTR_s00202p00032250 [Amborella trichopoda]